MMVAFFTLPACGNAETNTPIVDEKNHIEIPKTIIQEVTITEKRVPVANIANPPGFNNGNDQPLSEAETQPGQMPSDQTPPQDAIDACATLQVEDDCTINATLGSIAGTCLEFQNTLACVPTRDGSPGGGPPGGSSP